MERAKVKQIHSEISKAIEAIYKRHNLTTTSSRVRFDDANFNITIKAVEIKKPATKASKPSVSECTQQDLTLGFAKPGTMAWVNTREGRKQIQILSAARTNYTAILNGKRYKIPFKMAKLTKTTV